MPFSEWLTIRPRTMAQSLKDLAQIQESRVMTLSLPLHTDRPRSPFTGVTSGPVNSDRLAFVHRDRIKHERRGDRLVGAIAGQITAQAISGGLVIVYDVSVV